jgi:superfamily II DNA or RNA helicase
MSDYLSQHNIDNKLTKEVVENRTTGPRTIVRLKYSTPGIYIITSLLEELSKNIINKLGMSMRLEYRWTDYSFPKIAYLVQYVLPNKSKKEILSIESNILDKTKKFQIEGIKIEWRRMNWKELDQIIVNYFKKNHIKYERLIGEQIKQETPTPEDNYKSEHSNRTKELESNKIEFEIKRINDYRNSKQDEYLDEIAKQFQENNKCFIKAPTGFGKSHIFFKLIRKYGFNKILILTPRINLCDQILEDKYTPYINKNDYELISLTHEKDKEGIINKCASSDSKFILSSCYQSGKSILEYITKNKCCFNLIIFDEAHVHIPSWVDTDKEKMLTDPNISEKRLYASATPISKNNNIYLFGNMIEKVTLPELLREKVLCNIVPLIKQVGVTQNKYHNLPKLIMNTMTKYNKKKGIIYTNRCKHALELYELLNKEEYTINVYITISEGKNELEEFKKDKNQCVIICVGKISYGFDNDYIDFECFADIRNSEIDISQIIGRGLRWKRDTYPNKLLHILTPLYEDEFSGSLNTGLKTYLDLLIAELNIPFIDMFNNFSNSTSNNNTRTGTGTDINYEGSVVLSEILEAYCTTGKQLFSKFKCFLQYKKIMNEASYNDFKKDWMPSLADIHIKYPKFCFRDIHPNKNQFYLEKEEAQIEYDKCEQILRKEIGRDKYRKINKQHKLERTTNRNSRIPPIHFDLYYPKY